MRIDHPIRSAFDLVVRRTPVEAQLTVIRRCNLSCGYCTEYDQHSEGVPYEILCARIDAIHRLRAANIAMLGGEPLLHPRIDDLVRYAAGRAQVSITTNGFLLDRDMIDRLGDAGLANLQVSIDAARPDPAMYIQKTFRSLRPKLDRLAAHARFEVHITTVLCSETVGQLDELMEMLAPYPFRISMNIVHDERGQVGIRGPVFERAWRRHFGSGRAFSFFEEDYGRELLAGRRPDWTCSAGCRFLYVAEDGTVELCSAQRGRIGKQITDYTRADLLAHRTTTKGCERGCAVLCVYRDSMIDDDPFGLALAMLKSFREGIFRWRSPEPQPLPERRRPQRHLPLVSE